MSRKIVLAGCGIWGIFHLVTAICWLVNLVQLFRCDFSTPYKEEVIHGVGVIIPWASLITVWY